MSGTPSDVAQQALDCAGVDYTLGDIEDGTREAQVVLRSYKQCLMQLSRAVHWDFARKSAPLMLLADATGQTPNVGTTVPYPWIYEYALPNDCMKARFIPWQPFQNAGVPTGNIQIGSQPLMTGVSNPYLFGQRIVPARFTVATDYNYPVVTQPSGAYTVGTNVAITGVTKANPCVVTAPSNNLVAGSLIYIQNVGGMTQLNGNTYMASAVTANTVTLADADGNAIDSSAFTAYTSGGTMAPLSLQIPTQSPPGLGIQWWEVQGTSPTARTVILTNVQNATLVYTCLQLYPSLWDAQFRAAFVAYLASEVALPLAKDKKMGMTLRQQNIAIAKEKITQARITDGNEGWFNNDQNPDWMRTRISGGPYGGVWGSDGGGGPGSAWIGYGSATFCDGSAY